MPTDSDPIAFLLYTPSDSGDKYCPFTSNSFRQFGINEFKLKSIFKQVYGITVMRYLRKCRMDRAQDMLVNTDLEIKEIAFLIGFKYAHHFSKVYQAHFHVLPKDVRRHIYDNLLINKS